MNKKLLLGVIGALATAGGAILTLISECMPVPEVVEEKEEEDDDYIQDEE